MTQQYSFLALFPGQGSQKVGMGKELCAESELAREIFSQADRALGFSLSNICFDGPEEKLTATAVAQPAILTVSTILYRLYIQKHGAAAAPKAAAGHSLGEYSALVAADSISFDDAVVLVNKRGRYMQEAVAQGKGAMSAIMGKELPEIEEALTKLDGVAEVANVNAPGQVVVSGEKSALQKLKDVLPGTRIIELAVSAPFHCSLMQPAQDALKKDLLALSISPAAFPVYSNYSAGPVVEPENIRKNLELQVCGKVRWVESMQAAIEEHSLLNAIEFGHGNVLTGLLKRIAPQVARRNIDSLSALSAS